jgi:hypothetical protein
MLILDGFTDFFIKGNDRWYALTILVLAIAITLICVILGKALKRKKLIISELNEKTVQLQSQTGAANIARQQAIKDREVAQEDLASTSKVLDQVRIESSGKDATIAAYEKVFKESLMIANAKSGIAIDKSEILDILTVDDIRKYANSIGAKVSTAMTKPELIQAVRSREVANKNIANARSVNLAKQRAAKDAAADAAKPDSDKDEMN